MKYWIYINVFNQSIEINIHFVHVWEIAQHPWTGSVDGNNLNKIVQYRATNKLISLFLYTQ